MSSLTLIGAHRAVSSLLESRPESWDVVRFKGLFDRVDRRNGDLSYEMLSLRSTGEVVARADMGGRQEPDEASLPRYLLAEIDDLVVNPMWLIGGGIGVSRRAGAVSPDYRVFRPRGALLSRFIHYLLRSQPYLDQYLLYTRAQTTFDRRVQQPDLDNLPLPVPPLDAQRAIVDYLDGETARIDTLIEEQQQLIDLLCERRRAVIDHALMTDADRVKFSRLFTFHNGDRGTSYPSRDEFVLDGVPFVNAGHLRDGHVSYADMNYVSPEKYREMSGAKLLPGDVLFCIRGSLGKFGYFDGRDGGALASSLVAMRRIDSNRLDLHYLLHFLASSSMADAIRLVETGTAQPNLSVEQLARLTVPLPPVATQWTIASHLDEQTEKIDTLVQESGRFIELARERRSALIVAAVTGQIDVRETT